MMNILEKFKKIVSKALLLTLVLQMLFTGAAPAMASSPTPPIQTLQAPVNGSYVNYNDLAFFWDAATDMHSPVEYKFEISTASAVNAAPGSKFSGGVVYERDWNSGLVATTLDASDNGMALTNGNTYFWHVRAEDSVGGSDARRNTWSEVRSFTIDNTAPTVTVDSPASGSLLNRTVHIDVTANDSISSISRVDFYESANIIGTDSNGLDGYDMDWDTTGLNGNYDLTAVAFDSATSNTTSAMVTIEVDNNAPPSPVAGPPADGTIINPNTSGVALNWSDVTDPENHGLQYRIEALWDGSTNWVTWASGFISPFSLVGVGDASFKWRIVACDNVGTEFNCSAPSEERTLTLDSSAPIEIGEPIAKRNNGSLISSPTTIENVNWEWTAPDSSVAGLEYYNWQLYLDGLLYDSGMTISSKVSKVLSIEGDYVFKVQAKDNADNYTAFSESSVLEYDNTPPAIPFLDSPAADYYSNISNGGSYPTLSWLAVEDLDLAKYSFQICKDDPSVGPCNQEIITTLATTSRALINPLADGEYWWRVLSQDNATNKSAWSGARRILVDTIAPEVTITAPEDGLLTNNSTQTFTATASEDVISCRLGNPVSANVGLMVNWYHSYPEDTNGTWALISPSGTRIGLPDRYANAGLGGNSWVSPVSYSLAGFDTEDPNGTWTLTVGDYVWRDSGAVTSFDIIINGNTYSWSGWAGVYTGSTTNIPLTVNVGLSGNMTQDDEGDWTYTMSDVSDGLHTYQVTCADAAGNTGTSETGSITVDTTAPTATIDYSTTTPTNGNVLATATANEPVTFTNVGDSMHSFSENGSFEFTFVDTAGNSGSALATVNNIDKDAPTVPELLSPVDDFYTQSKSVDFDWEDSVDNSNAILNLVSDKSVINTSAAVIIPEVSYEISWSQDPNFAVNVSMDTPTLSEISMPDFFTEGIWYWRVRSIDALSNYSDYSNVRKFTVDWSQPSITLNGAAEINLTVGEAYSELGAVWTDTQDDTGNAVVGGDVVNTSVAGKYVVTYNYTDKAGNVATEVTRTVNVVAAPILPAAVLTPFTRVSLVTPEGAVDEPGAEVLGEEDIKDVAGDTAEAAKTDESKNSQTAGAFGISWYWWVLIFLLVAGGGYWYYDYRKKSRL